MIGTLARRVLRILPTGMANAMRRLWYAVGRDPLPQYDERYYAQLDEWQSTSYGAMARWIARELRPRFVTDVGSGSGALLAALRAEGIAWCEGIEPSAAGRNATESLGIPVRSGDLREGVKIDPRTDVCICVEVAEHVEERYADRIVEDLTSGEWTIVFSGATPGQGGHDHLNEQPHEYWIEKFARRGFRIDVERTEAFRSMLRAEDAATWYAENVMVVVSTPGVAS